MAEKTAPCPYPGHSHRSEIGGSSPQAGEFLLKERVVMGSLLLAFQPLHVALNPRVGAFGLKAREPPRQRGASIVPRPYPKTHPPASPGLSHDDAHRLPDP